MSPCDGPSDLLLFWWLLFEFLVLMVGDVAWSFERICDSCPGWSSGYAPMLDQSSKSAYPDFQSEDFVPIVIVLESSKSFGSPTDD